MKKSVILVEDDQRLQEQLVQIINSAPDLECVLAFSSAEEALKQIPGHDPDVVLLDINLPGLSGIDCLPELKRKTPRTEILILTAYEEDDNIFRALKAGASGYMLKSSGTDELFAAIRVVIAGGSSFSAHIARKIVRYFRAESQVESENQKLSPRERELLGLFASGHPYKEVAEKMKITVETARTYTKRICVKLQVRNRVEAIMKFPIHLRDDRLDAAQFPILTTISGG